MFAGDWTTILRWACVLTLPSHHPIPPSLSPLCTEQPCWASEQASISHWTADTGAPCFTVARVCSLPLPSPISRQSTALEHKLFYLRALKSNSRWLFTIGLLSLAAYSLSHFSHTIMLGLGFKTQRCVQEFGKVQSTILKQVTSHCIMLCHCLVWMRTAEGTRPARKD